MNYKEEQKLAREAQKRANHGKVIVCIRCLRGGEGGPLIKIDNKYQHKICKL